MCLSLLETRLPPLHRENPKCHEIVCLHPSHVDQWVRMLVSSKQRLEGGTGGCQDHLVSLHLLTILTGKGDIGKVVVFSQVPKGIYDILFEVIPLEAKFFRHFLTVPTVGT